MQVGCEKWCSWCCCPRPLECICCNCNLCVYCCCCPPPCIPPMEKLPCMPCMGPPPPPVRIIREQVLVPYPVPVPMCPQPTCPPYPGSYPGMTGHGFCQPMSCPMPMYPPPCPPPMQRCPPPMLSCCISRPERCRPKCGGLGDLYGIPRMLPPECCYEIDPEFELFNPCPPAFPKRLYRPGCPIVPGYQGHIPGLKSHGAGRTHGAATKDTRCIMSQWGNRCPMLPRRIYEQ